MMSKQEKLNTIRKFIKDAENNIDEINIVIDKTRKFEYIEDGLGNIIRKTNPTRELIIQYK